MHYLVYIRHLWHTDKKRKWQSQITRLKVGLHYQSLCNQKAFAKRHWPKSPKHMSSLKGVHTVQFVDKSILWSQKLWKRKPILNRMLYWTSTIHITYQRDYCPQSICLVKKYSRNPLYVQYVLATASSIFISFKQAFCLSTAYRKFSFDKFLQLSKDQYMSSVFV